MKKFIFNEITTSYGKDIHVILDSNDKKFVCDYSLIYNNILDLFFIDIYKYSKNHNYNYFIDLFKTLINKYNYDKMVLMNCNCNITNELIRYFRFKKNNLFSNFQEEIHENCFEKYYYSINFNYYSSHFDYYSLNNNLIKHKVELFFSEIAFNKDKIQFDFCTVKELNKYDTSLFWYSTCGSELNIGMHYYNTYAERSLGGRNIRYLIASYNNVIVGCIKIGEYGFYNEPKYLSMCYIDVNISCRKQGIATLLIKELDKYLDFYPEKDLVLTDESYLGKKFHMKDKFERIISSKNVVSYKR